MMPRVLIVDDEESICWGLSKLCDSMGIESEIASSAEMGLGKTEISSFDAVVLDVNLPGINGLEAIPRFKEKLGPVPVIVITAFGDLQTAISAIQVGAFEYILKPFDMESVQRKLGQAVAASAMLANPKPAETETLRSQFELVGTSALMQEVFKQIALTTTSESPVLVTGESGTGKELTARSIHRFSSRSDGPFVPVNIAALNPGVAESELFGHVKGSFTGADHDREGLIHQASGGTLFLDEVAEIPVSIQVKLLRVLDQQEVKPVGSNQPVKTDFRLISATNQDLLAQVNHGDFRHDLFYRLRTFEIRLPPLRQRTEDIPELVNCFLQKCSPQNVTPTQEFITALKSQSWPGNIRELQSTIERTAARARGSGVLTPDHLETEGVGECTPSNTTATDSLGDAVERWLKLHWDRDGDVGLYEKFLSDVEPILFPKAFELSGEQYSAAARKLGMHRTTLKKKLDEIEKPNQS